MGEYPNVVLIILLLTFSKNIICMLSALVFHSQCFKLYQKSVICFFFLLECFDLPFSIYCFALIAKHCLDFFNKIILILDIIFFFHLVDLLLYINSYYTPLSWANTVVILLSVTMTLLLLRNNQIPLHQSSNFV